ncbi:substrate-binding domain-containing protein [Nocardia sp. NBC_01009]|nr:substrate-binding domain-containing protein [Nocardia sp. NBC_01009]
MIGGDWSARSGYEADQVLADHPDVTAVFAANDHMALGLLRAYAERGIRVPPLR